MITKLLVLYRFMSMALLPLVVMGFISGELTWKKR